MTIIWQTKRFSCEKCAKGHRTNNCAHIKRSLQEIKAAGRPKTQCSNCRVKRAAGQGHFHHKCKCGSEPPMPYRESYRLVFQDGLELNFNSTLSINVAVLQVQVQQNKEMEIIVHTAKDDSTKALLMAPSSFVILREAVTSAGNEDDNPCKCHYGGECICSSLFSKDRKKKGLKTLEGGAAQKQQGDAATPPTCSCSTNCGCASSIGGCQCGIGSSTGNGGGCCSSTRGSHKSSCCS